MWSAADRGDLEALRQQLAHEERDVNARNCLGCTPLLYACGSGHLEAVRLLLAHPDIDVNRSNNDRLTSFMLAMQGGASVGRLAAVGKRATSENAQDKMKRLMDLPATDDLDWTRHDRWTSLMEACNFGHQPIVELLLTLPCIDLDAVNLRGQRAEDVAESRGYKHLTQIILGVKRTRENPEEMIRIQELQKEVEDLKSGTRQRLVKSVDEKYLELRHLKSDHESEIEPLSAKIDLLQTQLEEAMKQRLAIITRQVREIKKKEEEIRQLKKKLENFDRFTRSPRKAAKSKCTSTNSSHDTSASIPNLFLCQIFDKDFECSVCLEDMKPPTKIFQCLNGHVMCQSCQDHPEVRRCPTCRIPLKKSSSGATLMRNIPMEKLARSYYEKVSAVTTTSLSATSSPRMIRKGQAEATERLSRGGLSHSSDTAFMDLLNY